MKTNAIFRIVIWSIVILLLTAVLLFFLGLQIGFLPNIAISESGGFVSAQTVEETSRVALSMQGTVTAPLNIYKSPNDNSEIVSALKEGDTVYITKQETIQGEAWGLISEGWIQMDQVQTGNSAAPNPNASFPADQVHTIAINWIAGDISIEPGDVEEIQFWEEDTSSKHPLTWSRRNGKLEINFCEDDCIRGFGIHLGKDVVKDLFIRVPKDWVCSELELDAASAALVVRDLTIREVDIDTASGACDFVDCEVDAMDLDTASGDVKFSGKLNTMECDAASASFQGEFTNVPNHIDMDSMSGDLDITLPEEAGFTVKMDAMSSDFSSDFDTTGRDGTFVHGDGSCRIDMNAMSGDVYIRKAAPTVETTAP